MTGARAAGGGSVMHDDNRPLTYEDSTATIPMAPRDGDVVEFEVAARRPREGGGVRCWRPRRGAGCGTAIRSDADEARSFRITIAMMSTPDSCITAACSSTGPKIAGLSFDDRALRAAMYTHFRARCTSTRRVRRCRSGRRSTRWRIWWTR